MSERPDSLERFDSTPQNFLASSLQKIRDLRDVHHMVKTLEEENARLKSVLQQVTGGSGERHDDEIRQLLYSKTGYLNKYRPYATSSLFANTWEPRYIVLKDKNIMYYRNERDVYRNPPRGQVRRGVTLPFCQLAALAALARRLISCLVRLKASSRSIRTARWPVVGSALWTNPTRTNTMKYASVSSLMAVNDPAGVDQHVCRGRGAEEKKVLDLPCD